MKKTFQKTLIAAAAGVALMSAVGTASANSLLFPYFTTNTGAQSVLSLSLGALGVAPGAKSATSYNVHYVYNYGTACTHFDANGSLTSNDILTHSLASTAIGGFGKAVSADTSVPVYLPVKDTGFLVVSLTGNAATTLRGQLAIVDPSTGLVVSYTGIDNQVATDSAANSANEGNYSTALSTGTDTTFAMTALPTTLTTTTWYGVAAGDMSARILAGNTWNGAGSLANGGFIWDNDENPISGAAAKTITCAGAVTQTDLMTTAQAASVTTTGALVKGTYTPTTGTGLILVKQQSVAAAVGAPFAGKQFLHREAAGGL